MRYLVFLDINSPVGQMYARGSRNDGFGVGGYPVLDCTEINLDEPYYAYLNRDTTKHGGSYQKVYVPHSSVVMVFRYEDEESRPVPFIMPEKEGPERVGAA